MYAPDLGRSGPLGRETMPRLQTKTVDKIVMRRFEWALLALVAMPFFIEDAVAQLQEEEQTVFSSSAGELALGGRVQMQFNTSSAAGAAPTEMFLRRVRL